MRDINQVFIHKVNEVIGSNYIGVILFDMDDCLYPMGQNWLDLYNIDYKDNLTMEQLTDWDTYKFVKEECGMKIYDYLKHEGLFRTLKPAPYAQEVIQRLIDKGFDVRIVSDSPEGHAYCSNTPSIGNPADDKRKSLAEHFPMIDKKKVIFTSEKWYVYGDVIVDDKPNTVEMFQKLNRKAILINQPYNQHIDTPYRASNMLEVEQMIYKMFDIE